MAFGFSITACLIAAAASWSRGKRYVAAEHEVAEHEVAEADVAADIAADIAADVATDA